MPEVDPTFFGRHYRPDGKPGFIEIMPTAMRYVETDGSDVRLYRVRVYGPSGQLEHTCLQDTMGVRFSDLPDVSDDIAYLEHLRSPIAPELI